MLQALHPGAPCSEDFSTSGQRPDIEKRLSFGSWQQGEGVVSQHTSRMSGRTPTIL